MIAEEALEKEKDENGQKGKANKLTRLKEGSHCRYLPLDHINQRRTHTLEKSERSLHEGRLHLNISV